MGDTTERREVSAAADMIAADPTPATYRIALNQAIDAHLGGAGVCGTIRHMLRKTYAKYLDDALARRGVTAVSAATAQIRPEGVFPPGADMSVTGRG